MMKAMNFLAEIGRSVFLISTLLASVLPLFAGPAEDAARVAEILGKSDGYFTAEEYEKKIRAWWFDTYLANTGDPELLNDGNDQQPTVRRAKRPDRIEDMATYLTWKWRMNVSDPSTGQDEAGLKKGLAELVAREGAATPWHEVRAKALDYLIDNCAIGFSRFDSFPAIACWNRFRRPLRPTLKAREQAVEAKTAPSWFHEAQYRLWTAGGRAGRDYNHSAPDWDDILKLGFTGMKARVEKLSNCRINESSNEETRAYYKAECRAAAALLRFVDRLLAGAKAELARCGGKTSEGLLEREIASLERLRVGPPLTVFDVMQFEFVYFIVSEYFDEFQVRTFGNIDRLWLPYYEADLAAGRTTEAEFREDFRHFIWQFGSIDNYWGHPMYLGGTKADGSTEYNKLSMIILDVVDREALATPKFQLKIAKNTPDEIWDKALRMLRRHRSLVLMGEDGMKRSMAKLGLSDEECRKLVIWGCFEWLPVCGNCTSATSVNLVMPLVQMLEDARTGRFDAPTFDDFVHEYHRRLGETTDLTRITLNELERTLSDINPSLVLSLGIPSALERGVDAFSVGMRHNHTDIAGVGMATAVDSLIAVKELVYENYECRMKNDECRKARFSLKELGEILAKDWKGHEDLRRRMQRSHRKWGCGNAETDALARDLLTRFTGRFVGLPNVRGGKYVSYGLNSRGYVTAGRVTGATPDGRCRGEELSKNMAPAIGGDAEGVTAVLNSWAASIDPAFFPCGLVFDVMLHASSVSGEKGLKAFRTLCENYFDHGGCGLNLNVQSVEELKDAQLHPEKYENLQVRVAGWNVRWNEIPKKEQDGFIRRLEAMPE